MTSPVVSAKRTGLCGVFAGSRGKTFFVSTSARSESLTRQEKHFAFGNVHVSELAIFDNPQEHGALELVKPLFGLIYCLVVVG